MRTWNIVFINNNVNNNQVKKTVGKRKEKKRQLEKYSIGKLISWREKRIVLKRMSNSANFKKHHHQSAYKLNNQSHNSNSVYNRINHSTSFVIAEGIY